MANAKLTPVAKGLIGLVVLGGLGAAGWHLGLKNMVGGDGESGSSGDGGGETANVEADPSAPLGTAANPLKVSIVSFHGYAPALVANGNSLTTQPGSIAANNGVSVEYVIQDNVPTLTEIFTSGAAHCAWRTSDFWAQEQPNLRNAEMDGRAVMVVDNTQGGDAIIARDPAIRNVEDLVGKKVALLEFTPSHGMLIDAIQNSRNYSLLIRPNKTQISSSVWTTLALSVAAVVAIACGIWQYQASVELDQLYVEADGLRQAKSRPAQIQRT
ncbi:MAG: hypothetical protein AAF645_18350, partial [Myxococcota bacterium]